jgi:hypothetical protein
MKELASSLTTHEQLEFIQVTALAADTPQVRNLVTTVPHPDPLGSLAICAQGANQAGTKLFSATVYISGITTSVDVYRLDL